MPIPIAINAKLNHGWLPINEKIDEIKVSNTIAAPPIIKYNAICFFSMNRY